MRQIMIFCLILAAAACARAPQGEAPAAPDAAPTAAATSQPIAADVEARLAKLARTELKADLAALSPAEQTILEHLIAAAREMDPIFLRQAWEGNPALWQEMQSWQGKQAEAARQILRINFGPWDRLGELAPFVGTKPHPEGAGYYPEDMTKEEFEDWIAKHPEREGGVHLDSPRSIRRDGRRAGGRAVLQGVRRMARARRAAPARGRRADRERLARRSSC